jgi:leucyl aminopeptidase
MKSSTMEFSIKNDNPVKLHSDCVIIGIYEDKRLSDSAQAVDAASAGYLANILKRGDMDGKADATLILHGVPGIASERVLLVGLGKESDLTEKQYCKAVRASIKALASGGTSKACTFLSELPVKQLTT